ncbi:MAG: TetR/AcrR family transcriptional regulator [Beijerinckiaceae bacterium]
MAKDAKITAGDAPVPTPRDRIIDALMTLAGESRWDEITLPMIANRAEVSLADLRDHYPSKGAILGGFARRIDRIVLDGTGPDMLGEPARERVLDIMLRRLDALTPYKAALKGIMAAARRDPLMLAPLNQLALNSWRYMLAVADIDTEDDLGLVRVQGAALVFARTLEVWFEDEDAGLARTMARLDKELGMGERVMGRIEDVKRLTAPFRGFFRAAAERRNAARENRTSSRNESREARDF